MDRREVSQPPRKVANGLSWEELATILSAALATGRAKGIDITIFNPNLDQAGHLARRLVQLLHDALT